MSRLFISHSSRNDDWAIALKDWLVDEGWSGPDDIFLDLDPERGIAAGERWAHALEDAATRCEAVLFVVSEEWLASKWCGDEYQLANRLNKKLFALLIDDIKFDRLPGGMSAQWQVVHLKGEPARRFLTVHPRTQHQSPVHISEAGLVRLKRGLEKAGIGAETFELQPDANGPFGWRAPYRGLEALEPEDAAVFFGRNADIVRGIDTLRGLSVRKPPRLLVILGASGAGKSSFMRAGLWPRLLRDDSQWLPLRTIRASRGGPIEGSEGLLTALEDVHRRFALRASRADLRDRLATPDAFVELLNELRAAAAKRALMETPPYPLPVLCLDQAEELFTGHAPPDGDRFLGLARAAIDRDAALLLVSTRSDSYGAMQGAKALAGIDQVPLSLGPVPQGEIAHVIRGPAEILYRKVGSAAPVFDPAVIERLQQEIEGEDDALPILAFVLQRLMREHQGVPTIGLTELDRTGGVAAAIESAAEAALDDAGFGNERAAQRSALRRLFIPRLARFDRDRGAAQRRVALQSELPTDLLPLARALTERRLLVVKAAAQIGAQVQPAAEALDIAATHGSTLEVAHEALLRRWPTLAELLAEDRDALLLLDSVRSAASDWERADPKRKADFLAHRGLRLSAAQALASRGDDWRRELAPASHYLAACARGIRRQKSVLASLVIVAAACVGILLGTRFYSQYVRLKGLAAASDCDLTAGEVRSSASDPGVTFDRIDAQHGIQACQLALSFDTANPRLMHNLARSYEKAGSYREAADWYQKAANMKWAPAENNLGVMYLYGRGVSSDFAHGTLLLREAVEQGYDQAKLNYSQTDLTVLFESNRKITIIVQNALVKKGFLRPDAVSGKWGPQTVDALVSFRRTTVMGPGIPLSILDQLGVTDELAAVIGEMPGNLLK